MLSVLLSFQGVSFPRFVHELMNIFAFSMQLPLGSAGMAAFSSFFTRNFMLIKSPSNGEFILLVPEMGITCKRHPESSSQIALKKHSSVAVQMFHNLRSS